MVLFLNLRTPGIYLLVGVHVGKTIFASIGSGQANALIPELASFGCFRRRVAELRCTSKNRCTRKKMSFVQEVGFCPIPWPRLEAARPFSTASQADFFRQYSYPSYRKAKKPYT